MIDLDALERSVALEAAHRAAGARPSMMTLAPATVAALVRAVQAAQHLRAHLVMVGGGRLVEQAVLSLDAALAPFAPETGEEPCA